MILQYNETLKEYDITKEQFENSNHIVQSNGVFGKVISKDESRGDYMMGFCDGGCVIANETELHLFEVDEK